MGVYGKRKGTVTFKSPCKPHFVNGLQGLFLLLQIAQIYFKIGMNPLKLLKKCKISSFLPYMEIVLLKKGI